MTPPRLVQPAHPLPARRLRRRVRGDARAGSLAPGRPGGDALAARDRAARLDGDASRRAAGRSSTATGSSSRSGATRPPSSPTPARSPNPRAAALAAAKELSLDPEELYPKLADRSRGFVFLARKADPERAQKLKERAHHRRLLHLGGAPRLSAGPHRGPGARLRGPRQPRSRRARAAVRPAARRAARAASASSATRRGRSIDVVESKPARDGDDVVLTLDHTIQSYAESVLQRTVIELGREGGLRDRARPAERRDPRDGGRAGLRREPLRARAARPPAQPRRHGHVRAGLDLQGGDDRRGALDREWSRPGTAFTLPYEIEVADRRIHDSHERETQRMTVAQILSRSSNVGTITVAQMLGQNRLAPLDRALRLRPEDRRRLPGRDARDRAAGREVVGLDDRQRPDRPGDRGHARPDGRRVRRRRERRRLGAAAPRQAGRHPCRPPSAEAPPDRVAAGRVPGDGDDAGRRQRGGRHRRAGAARGLQRGRQDRAPPRSPSRAATPTRATSPRSSASSRRARRGSWCSSRSTSRAARSGAASSPRPAFQEIARYALQYLEIPPDDVGALSLTSPVDEAARAQCGALAHRGRRRRLGRDRGPRLRGRRRPARVRSSSASPARAPTGTTSRRPRSSTEPSRSSSSGACRSTSRRSSSRTRARRCPPRRPPSSGTRRASWRSRASPARPARRRPPTCSTRSSRRPGAGPG